MKTHNLLLPLAAPFLVSALASAQALNFNPPTYTFTPPPPVNWGGAIAILHAVDGARRDLVVSAPGDGTAANPGDLHVISADGPIWPNPSAPLLASPIRIISFPALGLGTGAFNFGHAVVNVGDVDGQPGEEFAFSVPDANTNRGTVAIVSIRPGGPVTGFQAVLVRWFDGPNGFGRSLAMVDTPFNGRLLAIGSPGGGLNQSGEVLLFDPSTGISPVTTSILTLAATPPSGFPGARIGDSIAGGPGGFVAVGAPGTQVSSVGFVAVYNLNNPFVTTFVPQSFLFDSTVRNMGVAVASLGQRPGFLPDFVALSRVGNPGTNSRVVAFRTLATGSTTGFASDNSLNLSTSQYDGSMAPAGDLDGDGFADFAVTVGGQLRLYRGATAGTQLQQLLNGSGLPFTVGAATRCGLSRGPDLNNQDFNPTLGTVTDPLLIDLVAGPAFNGTPAQPARVLAIASVHPVTWPATVGPPANVGLSTNGVRPILNSTFNLVTTNLLGPVELVALWFDAPPVWLTPFGSGLIFLGPTASSVTAGVTPMTTPITVPNNPALAYSSLVFQSVLVEASGNLRLSNGIVIKIGN